jgi:hypothetical protein
MANPALADSGEKHEHPAEQDYNAPCPTLVKFNNQRWIGSIFSYQVVQ